MVADASLFRLEQTAPQLGESLRVGLEFTGAAPWLKQVARVGVRLEGWVEYRGRDGEHLRRALPGSPEATREGALTGTPRLSFTVTVPDDVPPSHASDRARVEWALIASLYDERGGVLHEEHRTLRVMPRRTHQLPVPREPPVPASRPRETPGLMLGLILLPLLCCILPGAAGLLALLMGHEPHGGSRVALFLGAGALLVVGAVMLGNLLGPSRSLARLRVFKLEPLAEAFPLGSVARLRLYVELAEPLAVSSAELRLGAELHSNQSSRELLASRVPLSSLPKHLSAGWHTFDVEVPVPPDFIPGYRELLKTSCTVDLHSEDMPEVLHCSGPVRIIPELLGS